MQFFVYFNDLEEKKLQKKNLISDIIGVKLIEINFFNEPIASRLRDSKIAFKT